MKSHAIAEAIGAIAGMLTIVAIGYFLVPWSWEIGWLAFAGSAVALIICFFAFMIGGSIAVAILGDWVSRKLLRDDKKDQEAS
jgi:hypothetical protein